MNSSIKKVIIDPRCRINYASYYIEGLRQLFGTKMIVFKCMHDVVEEPRNGVAVKFICDSIEKRVFIDFWDGRGINEFMYQWADVYGKVNLSPDDARLDKVVPLGPNFGICLWHPLATMIKCVKMYMLIKRDSVVKFKTPLSLFLRDYAYMFVRRKKYGYYHRFTTEEQKGYAFSLNTLWWGGSMFDTTNQYRCDFIRLCKKYMNVFEGGFFYVKSAVKECAVYSKYKKEYHDILYKHRMSMSGYDKRSRKSWFVFSTPSVHGCHGWKLGEYLCEGKAIISTPLNNVMPGNFENGINYVEVTNYQEMKDAIIKLRDDEQLVNLLKRNAIDYFDKWVSPEASIRQVLKKAEIEFA